MAEDYFHADLLILASTFRDEIVLARWALREVELYKELLCFSIFYQS